MVVDILLVVLLVVFVAVAAKRGFMITLLEVAAVVLAVIISMQLCKPAANGMYTTLFEPSVEKKITEALPNNADGTTYAKKASAVVESLPAFARNYIAKSGIDTDDITGQIMKGDYSSEDVAAQLNKNIARPIAVTVLSSVLFMVFGILLMLILKQVAKALNKMFKIPIVGTANALLGGLFGLLKGVVVCYFLCCILVYLSERMGVAALKSAVDDSAVIAFVQSFNPVDILK